MIARDPSLLVPLLYQIISEIRHPCVLLYPCTHTLPFKTTLEIATES